VPLGAAAHDEGDELADPERHPVGHPDRAEVSSPWDRVADTFSTQFPKVTDMMNQAKADRPAFSAFPFEHWRKIWSKATPRVTKLRVAFVVPPGP